MSPLIDSPDEKVRWLILRAVEDARLLSCSLKIESALLSRGGTSGEHIVNSIVLYYICEFVTGLLLYTHWDTIKIG